MTDNRKQFHDSGKLACCSQSEDQLLVEDGSGQVHADGWIAATRFDLDRWNEDAATAVERRDGSHHVLRLDLRSQGVVVVEPFRIHVADEVLDDLRTRLHHTRWP